MKTNTIGTISMKPSDKKSVTRRLILLLLLISLLLPLGAGSLIAEENAEDHEETLTDLSGTELSIWIPLSDLQAQEFTNLAEHPFFQWIMDETGVTLDFVHPTLEQVDQQLTMMISSGDYYDLLGNIEYPGGTQNAIDEGCFVDLKPYLDDFMPHYKQALYEPESFSEWEWSEEDRARYHVESEGSFLKSVTTYQGQIWCMTQIWTDKYPCYMGAVIRKDWLDEAGLDIPVTFDDWEEVLAAFKERDVIPMNLHGQVIGSTWESAILSDAFDLYSTFYVEEDMKTIGDLAYVKPELPEYLNMLRDWYAKGYIDPDFMNTTREMTESKFFNDQLGIYLFAWNTSYYTNNYVGDQEFAVAPLPQPRQSEDQILRSRTDYQISPGAGCYLCLTTSCEEPEKACQFMDLFYQEPVLKRMIYGEEGKSYYLQDGEYYYLPEFKESEAYQNGMAFSNYLLADQWPGYNSVRRSFVAQSLDFEEDPDFQASVVWAGNDNSSANLPYITFQGDDWGTQQEIMTSIETYVQPLIVRYVMGETEIDFDEMREEVMSLGYEELKGLWQQGLDYYNAT